MEPEPDRRMRAGRRRVAGRFEHSDAIFTPRAFCPESQRWRAGDSRLQCDPIGREAATELVGPSGAVPAPDLAVKDQLAAVDATFPARLFTSTGLHLTLDVQDTATVSVNSVRWVKPGRSF